ncbi:MAG TPA: ATP-binding protein [Rhodanobacteraceae bacterium]|nr:ATP-binding protein [Rhodanobacteraceae bacterium]
MFHLRQRAASSVPFDAHGLATTIAWVRPCAALGQLLAIVVAVGWLHVALPVAPLLAGIAALALATPLAFWRLRHGRPVGEVEAVGHVTFDLLLLGWVLYFTGGASNPFITLLLVPVALSAAALSARGTAAVVALAAAVYATLIVRYVPLPDMSMHGGNGFRLHLTGMAINFSIAVLLLAVFINRMTASLRAQRDATQRLRERMLRDEGILAIATQAAEAAHELNTPLSTVRTLLPELEAGHADDVALHDDVRIMVGEVERCRDILRNMVDYGRQQLSNVARISTLGEYVGANIDRFRLLCPEAEVTVRVAAPEQAIEVQPGLEHALLNLMQNAFDASARNALRLVTLEADVRDGRVEFVIGDRGDGFDDGHLDGMPVTSSKPNGLGMGLALARSTIERLRGDLEAHKAVDGTRITVRLPLSGGLIP